MTVDKSGGLHVCPTCQEYSYGCQGQCKPPAPAPAEPPPAQREPEPTGQFRFTVEPLRMGSATYGGRRVR